MPVRMPPGPVTLAIAIFTTFVFVVLSFTGSLEAAGIIAGFIPARVSGLIDVVGGLPTALTPLGATVVHADVLHIGFNLLMLIFCGRFVETAIGGPLLVLLYVVAAYLAAFVQYMLDPMTVVPMIGASGAVSGVVGAYALLYSRQQIRAIGPLSSFAVRVLWLAAAWIVIQFMIELASFGSMNRVAIGAHVGGFLAGLLLARPLLMFRYRNA